MLAASAEGVEAAVEEFGEAFVEWKLDGVRIQVHRQGAEVRIYTRNLNDVTARLPEVVGAALDLAADTFVLDGEAMSLSRARRPEPFQDSMSRFGRGDGGKDAMTAFYFDCLHLDGADLIDHAFSSRRRALEGLVGEAVTPGQAFTEPEQARAFLDQATDAGHEGVMVKDPNAPYQAGRRGKAWRKVKPVVTVDLIVLAADWGHGRRKGWLSNLHLGARDPDGDFVMVGEDLQRHDRRVAPLAEPGAPRPRGRARGNHRPRPARACRRDRARRGTALHSLPGRVAIRFARVKRYRPDKEPSEVTTIDELRMLLRSSAADDQSAR